MDEIDKNEYRPMETEILDLLGNGQVTKEIRNDGYGPIPPQGATVFGTIYTSTIFDTKKFILKERSRVLNLQRKLCF
jgi:hypothetical protein